MATIRSRQIIVAGAGVAGLTAALAFAARGFSVQVFERSAELSAIGAGLQLSPNATRILARLGVLGRLRESAVRPEAVVLRDAATLAERARVRLGDFAESRWKSPYLVVHRADLQAALLASVRRESEIRLTLGASVRDIAMHQQGVTVSVDSGGQIDDVRGLMAIGADGVWSTLRGLSGERSASRFSGQIAWRRMISADHPLAAIFSPAASVNAFLHPGFHLIAYPVQANAAINLVAFTTGVHIEDTWNADAEPEALQRAMRGIAPQLAWLSADGEPWTVWPVHTISPAQPWTAGAGLALIGDAAHAMTPFAAQGAAMSIEDAVTLAAAVAARPDDLAAALPAWEAARRRRVARVRRRGAFNGFTWHATGPVARARDFVLKRRSPEKLAADMDWLYGWDGSSGEA